MKKTPALAAIDSQIAKLEADLEADRQKLDALKADHQKRLKEIQAVPDSVTDANIDLVAKRKAEQAIIQEQLQGLDSLWETRLEKFEKEQQALLIKRRRIQVHQKSLWTFLRYIRPDETIEPGSDEYKRIEAVCKTLKIWKDMRQWLTAWNAAISFKGQMMERLQVLAK